MSDKVDEANHDAKQETNGDKGLGGAKDEVGKWTKDDFEHATNPEDVGKFQDELDELIDDVMENVNANRLKAADKKMRGIRDKIKSKIKKDKAKPALEKLEAAAKSKRKITAPPLTIAANPLVDLLMPALASTVYNMLPSFIDELPEYVRARPASFLSEESQKRAAAAILQITAEQLSIRG